MRLNKSGNVIVEMKNTKVHKTILYLHKFSVWFLVWLSDYKQDCVKSSHYI